MKNYISIYIFVSLVWLNLYCSCENLQVGDSVNNTLVYAEDVKLSAIVLNTRTKNVFYSDLNNKIIKGVTAIDKKLSKSKATITAGGVGATYVNVKLKSERGEGLDYQVQIFV